MKETWTNSDGAALMQHFEAMLRIRYFEETVADFRKKQIIIGSVHLCIGQEAIYVGARSALTDQDRVFGTYRGHGWAIACGVPPLNLFAELMGKEIGVCKGRGGSAQLSAPQWGFYGENSIVGAGAAVALGAALSAKREGKGRVVLTAFGEGAMNQGAVHEAMNFAAYQDLPLIFICENNIYSELTPTARMVRVDEMYQRAGAYGMPGVRVDGNDPEAMRRTVATFVDAARAGKGPALVEAMTQRLVGHYIGDMQSYRPNGEIAEAKKTEPIVRVQQALAAFGRVDEAAALSERVRLEINSAAELACLAPLANAATIAEHLYA